MSKVRGDLEVTRELKTGSIATAPLTIPTSFGGSFSLGSFSGSAVQVQGSDQDFAVILGDATLYPSLGRFFWIFNEASTTIEVRNFSGVVLERLAAGRSAQLVLRDFSTQDGTWMSFRPSSSEFPPGILQAGETFNVPARRVAVTYQEVDVEDGAELDLDGELVVID